MDVLDNVMGLFLVLFGILSERVSNRCGTGLGFFIAAAKLGKGGGWSLEKSDEMCENAREMVWGF